MHRVRSAAAALLLIACGREDSPPQAWPAGKPKEEGTRILETGAQALQSFEPMHAVDTYIDVFHALREQPAHAQEAHLFCRARNEEFTQCVIFDANTANANLVGVEYIISERLYAQLPAEEKPLWHPHNYEVMSGQLTAPGLPEVAEHALAEKKLNSYGKTWQTWDTAQSDAKVLPLGPAMLGWSFNADGELPDELLKARDKRMNIDSRKKREARKDMLGQLHSQQGTSVLAGAFPGRKSQ
jgi:hypothetical protein